MEFGTKAEANFHETGDFDDVGLDDIFQTTATESFEQTAGESADELSIAVHDQLPNVEEYKTSQRSTSTSRGCAKAMLVTAVMIVLACVLITVGVVIGETEPPPPPAAKSGNHPAPSRPSRMEDMSTLLINMGWADSTAIKNPASPQYKAAKWVADIDERDMKVQVSQELMNRYLLATVYYALDGANWRYDVGFLSKTSVCGWNTFFQSKSGVPVQIGVMCHNGESVRALFLPNMGLKGELPPELGLLLDLIDLNLYGNHISGVLPDQMKELMQLEHLVLHNNMIKGKLPAFIGTFTKLQTLNLADNQFNDMLPESFANLKRVQTLVLDKNFLTGPLHVLSGLNEIRNLYLDDNEFSGMLTTDMLDSWKSLEVIDVSENLLTGSLPKTLLAQSNLKVADLHGNNFNGELPSVVNLEGGLQFLALQNNNLEGQLDVRLASLKKLAHLDVSSNFFTGDMPTAFGDLTDLTYLFMAFNDKLTPGPIPVEYARLTNLVDLSLQKTARNGQIPTEFGELKELIMLDINDNNVTGNLPPEIGDMANLKFLLAKGNKLSGAIPESFKNLKQVDTLLLNDNDLTGGSEFVCNAPAQLPVLTVFMADCDEMAPRCSCCSTCCEDTSQDCKGTVWFSDLDPTAKQGFGRSGYQFYEQDIIFPVPKENTAGYQNYTGYYHTPP